ncbi:hypothetical protein B4U79_17967 [Dinothrombium tinctorium]|uniref:MOSC domain-containing protein n=1 Tax=Dinothrombium tinctorium TaxID=1965070 RepID=A0A443RDR9_9ACAR|nr:hypothetical protein B4U79_17967 [Dinothrombium tinctorium]
MVGQPSLALLKLSVHDDELWIESPTNGTLKLKQNYHLKSAKVVEFEFDGSKLRTIDCGDEIATWFEKVIDKPGVRLLRHVPEFEYRQNLTISKIEKSKNFPLHSSCLIINDNSVSDLNKKLPAGMYASYRNFRPNILVECKPYSEDNWTFVQIADVSMQFIYLSERCQKITIDPDTSKKSDEPFKTLKHYRCPKNGKGLQRKPTFGTLFGILNEGQIAIGDHIYAKQNVWKIHA